MLRDNSGAMWSFRAADSGVVHLKRSGLWFQEDTKALVKKLWYGISEPGSFADHIIDGDIDQTTQTLVGPAIF
jgi:hypothetical protein